MAKARAVHDDMRAVGLRPNAATLNTLLNAHRTDDLYEAGSALFEQALGTGSSNLGKGTDKG